MKKILSILLIMVMAMPLVVKADAFSLSYYANQNVIVGGELDISIVHTNVKTPLKSLEVTYDPTLLSINKEDVFVSCMGVNVTDSKDLSITMENGKITIKAESSLEPIGYAGYDQTLTILLTFKALKEGNAIVEIDGYGILNPGMIYVNLLPNSKGECKCDNSCPSCDSVTTPVKPKEETTEEPKEEFGDDNVEIETTNDKETKKTDTLKKTDSKSDNTFFYGSLIVNVLQLIAIIILIVVGKKKNKTV